MTNTPRRDPQRIVVGYAHTPTGTAALCWAVREGQRTGAVVEAVHVFDVRRRADAALWRNPAEVRGEARQRAEQRIRAVVAECGAHADVRFTPLVGDVEDSLAARAQQATRLVLGEPATRSDRSLPARLSARCETPVTVVSETGVPQALLGGAPR